MTFWRPLVLLFFLLPWPAAAQNRNVDPAIFERAVHRLMSGQVKGYAFVIANANGIVAEAVGGWAQAPNDGRLRMSTSIPAGWGSNQKVLSGIALLDLLEQRPSSLSFELDREMHRFMPARWKDAYFDQPFREGLKAITLRDLLDHTSGLPAEKPGGSHGTRIARGLSEGNNVIALSRNIREYQNHNTTLLLYIIPRIAYPEAVARIEREATGLSLRDYNRRVAREYGKLYTLYMNEEFLSRVPGVQGSCRPGDLPNNRYAKEYDTRNDNSGRTDNAPDFCRSQGSWFYSARDMAHLHRAMEFTNTFVTGNTRRIYRVSTGQPRPIYWRTWSHPVLSDEAGQNFRGHGGRTRFKSTSATMRLPFGYTGVAVANSGEFSSLEMGVRLLAAFYEASRVTFEQAKDRPGGDILNFPALARDPQRCASACEQHHACDAWTYVDSGSEQRCWLKAGDPPPAPRDHSRAVSGVRGAQYGVDRPGANLMMREIQRNDAALCRFLCGRDNACKSWTFVPQNVQGPTARCWLKSGTPTPVPAQGLVSGLSP